MELTNLEVEDFEKENQEKKEETGSRKNTEPTDYNASQESVGTFGEKWLRYMEWGTGQR